MIYVSSVNLVAFKQWVVSKEESGTKLVDFLQIKLGPQYSLKKLKRTLELNSCTINKRVEHFGSTRLGWGDKVEFNGIELLSKSKATAVLPPKILFEDDDFLFIDKPPRISSEDEALLNSLKTNSSHDLLALAHRLDKDTSGVLAFTKTTRAKEALYRLFKERQVSKVYLAVVEGAPAKSQGRIENFLGKISTYQGQSLWGSVGKEKGSQAITEWKALKKDKRQSLIQCFPLTGRTHQIRVHLASIGHPILGDRNYGKMSRNALQTQRCLLHASEIAFEHPFKDERLSVKALTPPEFH